jgi:hypothetical protein
MSLIHKKLPVEGLCGMGVYCVSEFIDWRTLIHVGIVDPGGNGVLGLDR